MTKKTNHVIRVAIQRPLYKLLDYNWDLSIPACVGIRVKVPLGNTQITAIVVETNVESELQKLKSVIESIDEKSLFDDSMLSLLKWASRYYFYPIGEVLFHALPVALRKGRQLPKVQLWRANHIADSLGDEALKRSPKQYAMLQLLKEKECSSQELQNALGNNWKNILRELEKKGFVEQREIDDKAVIPENDNSIPEKQAIQLTKEQEECVSRIGDVFQTINPKPILLHGITGSGKTEVYLRSIEAILKSGKQVLILVPEIGLTPQLLFRFKEHFSHYNIVSLHSGLSNGERLQNWLGAKSGLINIVIGTRSAVFTPMKNLGAIIIDEEHDQSFKQQEGFLYQGRDMAIKRAHQLAIPILLGSATPSLESLHNVEQLGYIYLRLSSRPGKRLLPQMAIHDTRQLALEAGISNLMMNEIRQHIENKHQVMLFLNRRGFAPILMCPKCGWHAACQQCEIGMTYHAFARKTICHHCGAEKKVEPTCPECDSDKLTTQGQGTERIEQILTTHFPNTPVIRIDRDSTSRKGALEKKLKQVHGGEPVILIGTQMLTKGHDFPNLTLVGILDIDQALFSMDFRAHERLAQQIIQVAGRAGRGEVKGRVVLQSSQPEHPLLLNLLSLGYYQTAKNILNERHLWNYPPYGAQALIRVSCDRIEAGFNFLDKLQNVLQQWLDDDLSKSQSENQIVMLGPIPSPLAKRANRYRFQLLFSARQRGLLHHFLGQALAHLLTFRKTGGIRWYIDVDPTDFL